MKKKMKRSRLIKLSDIENLRSSPSRTPVLQPGKPPPLDAPATAATPQKQPMIKAADSSPNYMKATSSSTARKERSPVCSLNTQTGSDSKNMRRRNSKEAKLGSASGNKPTKTLTKTSSFKLVRTLTKTPSFKPVRGAIKKCATVALCAAEMNPQKPTCSSTLKDSKFPPYLMLSPGSTEAEGTSIMKVCPYTYCSLNGHHHSPLPPLKCFLKAKRRSMKTQKSMKLAVLSPHGARSSGAETEDIDGPSLGLAGDASPHEKEVLVDSVPTLTEVSKDFFIEIFAKNTKYFPGGTEKDTKEGNVGIVDLAGELGEQNIEPSFDGGDEAGTEVDNTEHVAEALSDQSTHSEIDFEENFRQYNNTNSVEMDVTAGFLEENKVEDRDADYSTISTEETIAESTDSESQIEVESHASIEEDDNISDATDMEWEEGPFSASEIDAEAYYLNKNDDEPSANVECTFEIKKINLHEEPDIISSDDIVSTCTEEILADEALQELYEETGSFGMKCNDSDFEMDVMPNDEETILSALLTGGLTYEKLASTVDTFQVPTTMEEKGKEIEVDFSDIEPTFASVGEPATESEEASKNTQEEELCETEENIFQANPQPGDAENDCLTDMITESLNSHRKDRCLQPDAATMTLQNKNTGSCQNSASIGELETNENHKTLQPKDEENDQNGAITVSSIYQELIGEAGDAKENQDQVAQDKLSFGVFYPSPSLSEVDQDDTGTNYDKEYIMRITAESQLDEISGDSNSIQDHFDGSGLLEPHKHQMDGQHGRINDVESQKSTQEDQDEANKFKVPTLTDPEEHGDSNVYKISLAEDDPMKDETMEEEACPKADAAGTCSTVKNGISSGSGSMFLRTRRNSMPEPSNVCKDRKWTIGCKKPIKDDFEEQRDLNPREPNFLPAVPDPEAEKVDLRHQIIDDRKNAEEWMLDYALQRAVTKLAPARKRKVALLVEAFETVLPIPKSQPHRRHSSAAFSHTRSIQACS